eukprot:5842415-Pyramimonas_sp.AAC.1
MKTLEGTDLGKKTTNRNFPSFSDHLQKTSSMCSEQRRAIKELYEAAGGDLVDGLPLARSSGAGRSVLTDPT